MINVITQGADIYFSGEIEKEILPYLAKIYNVSEEEFLLTSLDSLIYHNGVDQNSFHIIFQINLEEKYKKYETSVAEFILEYSKRVSVHAHLYFTYFASSSLYERIDKDYPLFLTESNVVNVDNGEETYEEEDVEIYDENVFSKYEDQFPVEEKKSKASVCEGEEDECEQEDN